jgi:hypothetical protein
VTDNHHNDPEHTEHTEHTESPTMHDAAEPAVGHDAGPSSEHHDDRDAGQEPAQHTFRVGDRVVRWFAPEFVMDVLDLATCDDSHPDVHSDIEQAGVDSASSHPRLKVLDADGNETWLCSREVRLVEAAAAQSGTGEPRADEGGADTLAPGTTPGEPGAVSGEADAPDTDAAGVRDASGVQYAVVDPRELLLGPNVRAAAALGKEFLASVRDRGVQEPITVRRRVEDGALVVRKGRGARWPRSRPGWRGCRC